MKTKSYVNTIEGTTNKLFNLTPLGKNKDNRPFTTKLKVTWYFDTPFSKFFLLFLLLMTVYAIIRIIFRGFW